MRSPVLFRITRQIVILSLFVNTSAVFCSFRPKKTAVSAWHAGLSAAQKEAAAAATSAWHAGLSAIESLENAEIERKKAATRRKNGTTRSKKTRSEWAEIERKRAATRRKNGTTNGRRKVSERAPRC
jgi:hypothetical protein